jgi:hypothetical protein
MLLLQLWDVTRLSEARLTDDGQFDPLDSALISIPSASRRVGDAAYLVLDALRELKPLSDPTVGGT